MSHSTDRAVGLDPSSPLSGIAQALLITSGLSIFFIFLKKIRHAFFGPLSRIPGPKWSALTSLRQLYAVWRGREIVAVYAMHQQYGPVVRIQPDLIAVIGNGQTWKQVYGLKGAKQQSWKKDTVFFDRPYNGIPGPISAEGPAHARMRKVLAKAFGDKALREYEPRLQSWAALVKNKLAERARSGEVFDMVKILNCTTFDIMSDLTFGESLHMLDDGEYVPWVRLIFDFLHLATRFRTIRLFSNVSSTLLGWFLNAVPGIKGVMKEHHQFISDRVDKRLETPADHPDIWSLITEDKAAAGILSKEEQYSVASELMIAGTETTASALSGILVHLSRSPHWMAKLIEELRSQYDTQGNLSLMSLQSSQLLNAILHEGLRMYPPFPIGTPRIVPQGGAEINGYYIPENTRVTIYQKPTYMWEDNFHFAHEFRPERWLGDPEFKDDRLDAFEAFSAGMRDCIGKNFAWHEMRLLLATTLIHFDIAELDRSNTWLNQGVYVVWEKKPLLCKLVAPRSSSVE